MSSVDDRIVNMQFNNKQFTQGVTESQKSLQGLEQSLNNTAKSKGLTDLANNVQSTTGHFSAMKIAGISAIATIASKATTLGLGLVKSLTLDPVMQGFSEYQTNLQSIQTIMANTGKTLKPVSAALNQLNTYSDLTIYNFSEMAKNIGTFSAAGVKLKPAVASIQGIANIAALSGSNSQQASMAMYQLSQAISSGTVHLQDWNSVVNAGMGGKQLQRALLQTGQAMGTVGKEVNTMADKIRINGMSFRESISAVGGASWLNADVLTKTLTLMDGRLSKTAIRQKSENAGVAISTEQVNKELEKQQAIMKKQGFTPEQIKSLTKMADAAYKSATVVKTLPQLLDVTKEQFGSLWSSVFSRILGNFNQSKKLWTKASDNIGNIIRGMNVSISHMLDIWAAAGGRKNAIIGFKEGFSALGKVLGTVKMAFKDVFPPGAGSALATMSLNFANFMDKLTPSKPVLEDLRKIFGGIFAVLHIGFAILKGITGAFTAFFGEVFKGSGDASHGILDFVAHIGELLMKLDKFLTSGGKMTDVFKDIGKSAGQIAGQGIQIATNIIAGILAGLNPEALKAAVLNIGQNIIDWLKGVLGIHSPSTVTKEIGKNIILGIVQGVLGGLSLVLQAIDKLAGGIMGAFKHMLDGSDPIQFAQILNSIFTGALLVMMVRFVNSFSGVGKAISQAIGNLGSALQSLQTRAKAELIRSIAESVAVLAASMIALSLVPKEKLMTGIGAIGSLMGMMTLMMAALSKIGDEVKISKKGIEGGGVQLLIIGKAIQTVATAMLILSAAVTVLGRQDPEKITRGIGELALVMGLMIGTIAAFAKIGKVGASAATSILIISVAMDILIAAITALGLLPFDVVEQGIGAIGIVMGIMTAALFGLSKSGKSAVKSASAILIVAGAMTVMAAAVAAFGNMDMETLKKGLGSIAISLGLFVVTLRVLAKESIGVGLAASAILILAGSMGIMAAAIKLLGGMSLGDLGKGLAAVGAAFAILLFAAAAAEGLAPGLLILSVALEGLGAGLALAGLGMLAFATGMSIMVALGAAGMAVMGAAIQVFLAMLPALGIQLAAMFVSFAQTIAAASPKLREAFNTIFQNMIGVITDNIPVIANMVKTLIDAIIGVVLHAIPKWGQVIQQLITTAIRIIKNTVPQWIDAGMTIISKFLSGIAKRIPEVIKSGTDIVVNLIEGLGRAAVRIANATGKTILQILQGIDSAIVKYSGPIADEGRQIAMHLIDGLTGGLLGKGLQLLDAAVQKVADHIPKWLKKIWGISSPSKVTKELGHRLVEGLAWGITSSIGIAVSAAVQMANAVIAVGDEAIARVQARASALQRASDAAQAKADVSKSTANRVNAKKNPKLAKKLKKQADRDQEAADNAQSAADAAAQQVQDAKDFASSDLHGKGDIRSTQAVELANQASRMLAKANAEAAQAQKLMKTNKKAGKAMLVQAQRDAAAAKALADQAQASNAEANRYYAQEVKARIAQIEADRKADEDAKAAQTEYDAADTQGKIDILNKRAEIAQAKADAANAQALSLVSQAKALADSDAAQAMVLLDQAEEQAALAKQAADDAAQAKDQAAQLLNQNGVGGLGGGGSIEPSRSVLEDAASVVDRYSASLAAAEEAAAATVQPVQFVQNNYSPASLSASDTYRLTNNLLSAAQIKMGVKTPPSN